MELAYLLDHLCDNFSRRLSFELSTDGSSLNARLQQDLPVSVFYKKRVGRLTERHEFMPDNLVEGAQVRLERFKEVRPTTMRQ
jgi:hypothetical protein